MNKIQAVASFVAASVSLVMATAVARADEARPNVVVIFLDDSGYGDYAHAGNPVIETPNISRLAAGGANFTQFYVTSSACSASRYSLLTGRYPGHSGFGSWVINPDSKPHLRVAERTLAEGLKTRGYATGMFGKWHLGNPNANNGMTPEALPLGHGFDTWTGTNVSHDYDVALLLKSDPTGKEPVPGYSVLTRNLPSDIEASTSLTNRYTEAAVAFIAANRKRPFFAYLAHNQPHLGLFASEAFRGKSRRGLLGDVMAEIDDSVGRIMKALEENGVADNTLVIFSSDNGPWIRFENEAKTKYGEARLHVGYAQPFRDGKGSNWEGGHRVPGIFYWPGVIEPLRQLEPASTLDVLPTVFALCGAEVPKGLDGRDIRPLLSPGRFKGRVAPFELAYSGADNLPNAFREGPWKLHVKLISQTGSNHGFVASREKPLLFNVEEDLGERIDRATEQPEIVARLLGKLDAVTASLKPGAPR
jgi:arylsulfatase A